MTVADAADDEGDDFLVTRRGGRHRRAGQRDRSEQNGHERGRDDLHKRKP